jgi:hypothetical protein
MSPGRVNGHIRGIYTQYGHYHTIIPQYRLISTKWHDNALKQVYSGLYWKRPVPYTAIA